MTRPSIPAAIPSIRSKSVHAILFSFCLCLIHAGHAGVSADKPRPSSASREKTLDPDTLSVAVFAGGSFWCLEPAFEALPGVIAAEAGYTGGNDTNPTFDSVSEGKTGHMEAVLVRFNSRTIGYDKLLDAFWRNIDPTRQDAQFTDEGPQFRTAVFYRDEAQKRAAEASKARLEKSHRFGKGKHIVTGIIPASKFYPAEERNQDFYKRNPGRYRTYLMFSGRDKFFRKYWGATDGGAVDRGNARGGAVRPGP